MSSFLHCKVLYIYICLGIISIIQCFKIDIKELSMRIKDMIQDRKQCLFSVILFEKNKYINLQEYSNMKAQILIITVTIFTALSQNCSKLSPLVAVNARYQQYNVIRQIQRKSQRWINFILSNSQFNFFIIFFYLTRIKSIIIQYHMISKMTLPLLSIILSFSLICFAEKSNTNHKELFEEFESVLKPLCSLNRLYDIFQLNPQQIHQDYQAALRYLQMLQATYQMNQSEKQFTPNGDSANTQPNGVQEIQKENAETNQQPIDDIIQDNIENNQKESNQYPDTTRLSEPPQKTSNLELWLLIWAVGATLSSLVMMVLYCRNKNGKSESKQLLLNTEIEVGRIKN